MESKLIFEREGLKTYALVYEKGDEFMSELQRFAEQHALTASHFTAIGAFSNAVVGFFVRKKMDYLKIPIKEQVEVRSLTGNITSVRRDTKSMLMLYLASLMRVPSEGMCSRRMFGLHWK